MRPFKAGFPLSGWQPWWDNKTTKFGARFFVGTEEAYREEGIHTSPNVLGKFVECDGIPIGRFVTDLNLTPVILITWPLKVDSVNGKFT